MGIAVAAVVAADRDEPARPARVGHRVRHPDLRLHDRHHRHDPHRAVPDLRARRRPAGAQRRPGRSWPSTSLTGFALVFLLLRAFSSGCAALTGVEAISNGVPAFKPPKSRNAATTLLLLGVVAVTMLVGIIALARLTGLQFVEDPASQIVAGPGRLRAEDRHHPARRDGLRRPARSCCTSSPAVTALILFLAANTAFNGFPVLGSILAQDRYLPRQLHTRGDRLAFSNGIVFLAVVRDRADRGVPGRGDPADPALHRRACSSRSRCPRPACSGTGTGCCAPSATRPCAAGCSARGPSTASAW